ncbi:hypothetical protein ACFO6R_06655 [Eubacterium multiforme]|uniref:Lysyl-tRNA synthetase class II n=1 Tax=Eubacterium multiforme TaxID=83339 RepID=A0ABT9USJ0_9FIRM|nr:hypothetical protein [Eubacterium multiforme]MDQ0149275.1 lysyl-tRNA synthetase class II [Eubacterium multiforme]
MFVKKKGYILLSTMLLISFISIVILGGASIHKMNFTYSKRYKAHKSMRDLDRVEETVLKYANNWINENTKLLIEKMKEDFSQPIKNSEYRLNLNYIKDKDTFKLSYGIDKIDDYIYCSYIKNEEKIILIPKRRINVSDT